MWIQSPHIVEIKLRNCRLCSGFARAEKQIHKPGFFDKSRADAFEPRFPIGDGSCDFEDDFEFYGDAEREAGDADDCTNRCFLDAENISKQIRDSIPDSRLIDDLISGCCNEYSESNKASHSIERTEMLPRRSEDAKSGCVGGIPRRLYIELFANAAYVLRLVLDNREHSAQEEQVACLDGLGVGAKRRGRRYELNAKLLQPAFGARRLWSFRNYHRPTCAPPSTYSTSPVT